MNLSHQLTQLESAGLIQVAETIPEIAYLFRHALVQEAAYSSLLKSDRLTLHRATGQALEQVYADRLEEFSPLLAHHFHAAGELGRAVDYYILAGDRAFNLYALTEAIEHYSAALELAQDTRLNLKESARLYTQRGRALEHATRFMEALQNYQQMQALGERRAELAVSLEALIAQATLYAIPSDVHDPDQVEMLCDQALELASQLGDQSAIARILRTQTLLYGRTNRYHLAVNYGERAVQLARELGQPELLAVTLHDLGHPYFGTKQFQRGQETLKEAQQIFRSTGNLPMLVDNLATAIYYDFFMGNYEQAIHSYLEAAKISKEIGNLWGQAYCRMYIGYIYIDQGEIGNAINTMEECIRLSERAGFIIPQSFTRADLGSLFASLGDFDRAITYTESALQIAKKYSPAWIPWSLCASGRVHTLRGEFEQAKVRLIEARQELEKSDPLSFTEINISAAEAELDMSTGNYPELLSKAEQLYQLREIGFRSYLSYILFGKAFALYGLDQLDEAQQVLDEARAEARSVGSRQFLWRILALEAQIALRRDDPLKAAELRNKARTEIHYIADHISYPELRTSFLNLPQVTAVLLPEGDL